MTKRVVYCKGYFYEGGDNRRHPCGCHLNLEPGGRIVSWAGAPGTGRIVYRVVSVNRKTGRVVADIVENTIRVLEPEEVV